EWWNSLLARMREGTQNRALVASVGVLVVAVGAATVVLVSNPELADQVGRSLNSAAGSAGLQKKYVDGEILVKYRPGTSADDVRSLHAQQGTTETDRNAAIDLRKVKIPTGIGAPSVDEIVDRYRRNPNVLYAEPNFLHQS